MNELKRDLASERFGDSKIIDGTFAFAVESLFLTGFFSEDFFCLCQLEIGDGISSCKAEEVLPLRRVDTGDWAAALLKAGGIFPIPNSFSLFVVFFHSS